MVLQEGFYLEPFQKWGYVEPLKVPVEHGAEEPFKVILRTFFSESVWITTNNLHKFRGVITLRTMKIYYAIKNHF